MGEPSSSLLQVSTRLQGALETAAPEGQTAAPQQGQGQAAGGNPAEVAKAVEEALLEAFGALSHSVAPFLLPLPSLTLPPLFPYFSFPLPAIIT